MERIVYLDDGHGMETAGKRTPAIPELGNRVIRENEFNRVVIENIKTHLERSGIVVVKSAPTDKDHPLAERVRTINTHYRERQSKLGLKNVQAIVCSVHYNAYDGKFDGEDKDPSGVSVFYHTGSTKGKELATKIYNHLIGGTTQKKRGIKDSDFYIVKNTFPPAILSENGFMDNKREALLMIDEDFIQEVSLEHAKGICEYFGIPFVEAKKEEVRVKAPEGKIYRVQLGAFSYEDNAKSLLEKAKALGLDAIIKLEDK